MTKIELILDLYEKEVFWEKWSLINALIAVLTPEEVCSFFSIDKNRENRRNSVLDVVTIDEGDASRSNPSIRKIMLQAAQSYAAGLIAVHNHPSGDPTPSEQDKLLTRDSVIAGRAMDIRVFDHLIIGDGRYFSFADGGLIEEYEMHAFFE